MTKPKPPFEPETIEVPAPYVDGCVLIVPTIEDEEAVYSEFYERALEEQMRRKK